MKSCEEMVASLLDRRDRYAAARKRRRRAAARVGAGCLCLAVLLGAGLWTGGTAVPSAPPTESAPPPAETEGPAGEDEVVVNPIDALPEEKIALFCLLAEDFVTLERDALNDYYGVDVFPDAPADLEEWEDQPLGVFRRDGGAGQVYWDANLLNYASADGARKLHLTMSKAWPILTDTLFEETGRRASRIRGQTVTICRTADGYYFAGFEHRGVQFRLHGKGLSEAEFVAVVASLLD